MDSLHRSTLIYSLAIGATSWLLASGSVLAEETQSQPQPTPSPVQTSGSSTQPVVFNPPPGLGMPGNREGGGSRGCGSEAFEPPLTALIPESNMGLTTAERPSFFWLTPNTQAPIEFVLNNAAEENLYSTFLTGNSGVEISSFTLPAEVDPLELNQDYHWYVAVICNRNARSADIVIDGWIRRVALEPEVDIQLKNPDPIQRISIYADHGLWYNAVSQLMDQVGQNPTNPRNLDLWTDLWTAVDLGPEGIGLPLRPVETLSFSSEISRP